LGFHTEHRPPERQDEEPTPLSPRRRPLN
jgi:hypothetical protein